MRFAVVLHTDDGVRYGVTVPDLPGCFSAGDTVDEALASVAEAIELHLEGMAADGEPLSAPRALAAHRANPDYAGGVWAVVEVAVGADEAPVAVSLPAGLVRRIDAYARDHHLSRAGALARAAEVLGRP